jgi:hypothetical protein
VITGVVCEHATTRFNWARLFTAQMTAHTRPLPILHNAACTCVNRNIKFSPLIDATRLLIARREMPWLFTDNNISRPEQLLCVLYATEREMEVIRKTMVFLHFSCHTLIVQSSRKATSSKRMC